MRQINIGNVLPFYAATDLKSEVFFASASRHYVGGDMRLLPFQLNLPPLLFDTYECSLFDKNGAFVDWLTIDDYIGVTDTNGNSFVSITYKASSTLPLTNCKRYQVRVSKASNSSLDIYFSDWILVKTNWTHQITFTNATDIGSVFYQNNYVQKVFFDGYEDTPQTDIETNIELSLNGSEVVTSARQTEKRVVVGIGFLDSQLSALQRIAMNKTITFNDRATIAETATVTRLDFEHEATTDKANKGTFIFTTNTATVEGCGVNTFTI